MFRFVLIFAALAAAPVSAFPNLAFERAAAFAICSGRMSAMHVRQQADRDPDAPTTYHLRIEFDHLLDAIVGMAYDEGLPEKQPSLWRVQGWTEVANLLNHVHYNVDPGVSAGARLNLERHLQDCRDLILPT